MLPGIQLCLSESGDDFRVSDHFILEQCLELTALVHLLVAIGRYLGVGSDGERGRYIRMIETQIKSPALDDSIPGMFLAPPQNCILSILDHSRESG